MSLADSKIVSKLVDEMDPESDVEQSELNMKLLKEYDKNNFLEMIERSVDRYEFLVIYMRVKDIKDTNFWTEVLRRIIFYYRLNSLKMKLSDVQFGIIPGLEIAKLLWYIKIVLLKRIDKKKFRSISLPEIKEQTKADESAPALFKYAIENIDVESFELFKRTIIQEAEGELYI